MTHAMPDPEDDADTRRVSNLSAMEQLVTANEQSNRTMLDLVESVRQETVARDRKVEALDKNLQALEKNLRQTRWITGLVAFAIAVLLTIGTINAINLAAARKQAQQTRETAAQAAQINQTLLDCVNSTGVCGQVNQENQARILDTVKMYELTVIYCARTNPQPVDPKGDKFLDCVTKLYPGGPKLDRKNQ
jgi:hypothetical protein